jgi:hypothetical protein
MQDMYEDDRWRVIARRNAHHNLTIEIELDGVPHAELVLQTGGTIDLGTKARPWDLGEIGWQMPGAPSADLRKFRFGPDIPAEG